MTAKHNSGFKPEVVVNNKEIQKYDLLNDPFTQEILARLETDEEFRKGAAEAMREAQFEPIPKADESIDFLWEEMKRCGDVVDGNIVDHSTRDRIKLVK